MTIPITGDRSDARGNGEKGIAEARNDKAAEPGIRFRELAKAITIT
tara:strand:+ start:1296 stop:1433 length:138 start_codon:yes stop_codon:yes gene_type:complete